MLDSTDRMNIPLERQGYVRFVPYGAPTQRPAFTTRLSALKHLPAEYDYIAESKNYAVLGIWVDGIGRVNGNSAETFVRTIARRVSAAGVADVAGMATTG
ncbi:hypothetical protein [Ancylobacter oerskovii]|uniref:Uncharacterized protein n=1 Tax=Ancylobacter oerskovii TaxID=459519 RepID=A0ABW4Z2T8_9HYPH|nr:hypothetical protein [Ancylobacter oerskovii]MBS7544733.1 hypothetical protein [Ancylobacter oerskovii]